MRRSDALGPSELPNVAEALVRDLSLQRESYRALIALCERMLAVLEREPAEAAMPLLDEKRRVLEKAAAVDGRLAPLRERWPELRAAMGPENLGRAEAAVEETRRVLERLVELENRTQRAMQARLPAHPPAPRPSPGQIRDVYGA